MSNDTELLAAVDAIKDMKPKDIAALIQKRRIKGRPGTTGRCPLAVLMQGAYGGHFVVGQKFIIRQSGRSVEKLRTPSNLASFVRMFDQGQFPGLVAMPPRCDPRHLRAKASGKRSGPSGVTNKRAKVKLHLARIAQRFKPSKTAGE